MTLFQCLVVLLLLVVFPLPGILLAPRWVEDGSFEDGLIPRVAFGYALGVILLYACAEAHIGIFIPAYFAVGAAGIVLRRRRGGGRSAARPMSPEFRILLLLVCAYLAIRFVPVVANDLPVGWDPYFHLLFADRIRELHRAIHDWLPYEDIALNYPLGPHLLIALVAWVGRVPVHVPFKVAIPWFTALTGLGIFSLLSLAARNKRVALYGAASYLFTADYGSFGYALWGGLPNLMGMTVFLALLGLLVRERKAGAREIAVFAILFLGVSLLHHHCMVTAGLVLVCVFASVPSTRPLIWRGSVAAALLGAPYYYGYLSRAANLPSTGIAAFNEPAMSIGDITRVFAPFFFFACVFGALVWWRKRRAYSVAPVYLSALGGFLLCFVVGDYLIRVVTIILYYRQVGPFTPSRFLTDAVMLLTLFAGVFFAELESELEFSRRQILAIILAGFVYLLPIYRDSFAEMVPERLRAAYAWISQNSRPDAWVLDGPDIHTSYLTRRASSGVPFPTSEFSGQGHFHAAMMELGRGGAPAIAQGREIFAVLRGGQEPLPGYRIVWSGDGVRVAVRGQ